MLILVINCGSSSVKYNLFDIKRNMSKDLGGGMVERIGEKSSALICKDTDGNVKIRESVSCQNHYKAVEIVKNAITRSASEIKGIGHRVVHGGEEFNESVRINKKVLGSLEKFSELAPLHNPSSLEGIKSCMKLFPGVPQIAVFDTAFHQTMPEYAFCYAIPYEFYKKDRIRRYGFHGTSHRYVSIRAAKELKKPLEKLNLITVHLGNGCSMTAIASGRSVDTSMGFTPLEGLVMGTRSGDIDPAIVTFLIQKRGFTAERVNNLLNKESGLLGVSGISNDMRDILRVLKKGNKQAKLAYDIFVYRIKRYIGGYAAVLGRVDAVVFTAGIGENVPEIKESLEKDLRPLLGGKTKFLIIKTNEELLIAEDTCKKIEEKQNAKS